MKWKYRVTYSWLVTLRCPAPPAAPHWTLLLTDTLLSSPCCSDIAALSGLKSSPRVWLTFLLQKSSFLKLCYDVVQLVLTFLIIAFCCFIKTCMMKLMNSKTKTNTWPYSTSQAIYFYTKSFGWRTLVESQRTPRTLSYIDVKRRSPELHPLWVKCIILALMSVHWSERTLPKALVRARRVISSRDCVRLKNTEFHTELARPAGTGRYWFSNGVERGGRKCSIQTRERKRGGRYVRRAAHAERKDKKAEWRNVGTWPLKLYQCHPPPLLFLLWHL